MFTKETETIGCMYMFHVCMYVCMYVFIQSFKSKNSSVDWQVYVQERADVVAQV